MAPGSGGPVKAGTIASQSGFGNKNAPYTGIPGQTDTVFDPFSANPVAPDDRSQQDFADERRRRYQDRNFMLEFE